MSLFLGPIVQEGPMVTSERHEVELLPESSRAVRLASRPELSRELVSEGCEQSHPRVRILNASRILYRTSSVDVRMYTSSCETVVTITGELDVVSVRPLESVLQELVGVDDVPTVLRLEGLTFIDSRGLQSIAKVARMLRCAGSRLILRSVSSRIVRLLELTGIDQLLCIEAETRTAMVR